MSALQAAPIADAAVNPEYQALLDAVRGRGEFAQSGGSGSADAGDAAYQFLLSRERRVLDTIDRVVNDVRVKDADEQRLLEMPLHVVLMRTMTTVRTLMDDLLEVRSPEDAWRALTSPPERKTFIGVFLLLLGILAACAHAAT